MMKRVLGILLAVCFVLMPMAAMADVNLGNVIAASKDINIVMFGSLKTLPHFIENADFNDDDTSLDLIGDENGDGMADHTIRTEVRLGWKAKGDNWDFLAILESDFILNKVNADRQAMSGFGGTKPGSTANPDNFAVEKLNFGYDFGPVKLNTGWNTKFVDLMTGGILYGDDHPYIGLAGKTNNVKWELLYLIIQDDLDKSSGFINGDNLDWRAYTLRVAFDADGYTLAPIYAYSDNEMADADVHYLGVEGYGKVGNLTPRFEFIYAVGDKGDNDVSAWGAYASVEMAVSKAFNPYIGGYYLTGDDDSTDGDVEAFNGITNISRYSKTFGMENNFISRTIGALGSVVYSNNFNLLGTAGSGYGGIGNSSRGDAPGMVMIGAGAKGALSEQVSYKTQIMYFAYEETGAIEQVYGTSIDDEVGIEFDLQVTYTFSKHFSLGNVFAVFLPGDGIEDRLGSDYDEPGFIDTIEMIWKF